MHVHILGICGTFMGSLALLARDLGHTVTGSDTGIYPPMSTQLERAGVTIEEGFIAKHLDPAPDLVIVGNVMKRGIEAVEYMLDEGIPYTSGPQFLSEQVLQNRHVLAVAGTHGKTTTTTMLAWIIQYCGIDTGFLIGGVPLVDSEEDRLNKAFAHSSYLGSEQDELGNPGYFVIEADEYDSAFFDKRSKFVHYRPRTTILNNLEFDHADIFKDLDAIQTQFHHMIRMIPSTGQIIMPANTPSLEATIDKGCWTPIWRTEIADTESLNSITSQWYAELINEDGGQFNIQFNDPENKGAETESGHVKWHMSGRHNVENAMVAIAAAHNIGITVADACNALSYFSGIKRRMELIADLDYTSNGIKSQIQIFDDFAHHPTAISTTLDGAKKKLKQSKIWAIIEPRSNTMKLGVHKDSLASSAQLADEVIWYEPAGLEWGLSEVINSAKNIKNKQSVMNDSQQIIDYLVSQVGQAETGDTIIIMSNGGFEGIHKRLIDTLHSSAKQA